MKKIAILFASALFLSASFTSCNNSGSVSAPQNTTDSLSYAYGVAFGSMIKDNLSKGFPVDMNYKVFGETFAQVVKGDTANIAFTAEEANKIFQKCLATLQDKKALVEKAAGEKFIKNYEKNDSVKVTESGIAYKIIKAGKGDKPTDKSTVVVNYKGTLLDGTVFDSSYDRKQPATFPLNGVIKGWTEGIQLMSPGAHFQFVIPSELAYGNQGNGPKIKPGATLIFDVELLEVK